MKVFLDTNVLIAAFLWKGGVCDQVLEIVYANHELLTSEVVIEETRRTLLDRFRIPAEKVDRIEAELREHHVAPRPAAPSTLPIPDPDDAWVLASALQASADLLITGDKPFLSVANQVNDLRLLSPRSFLEMSGLQ